MTRPLVREGDRAPLELALRQVLENLRSGDIASQRAACDLLSNAAQNYLPEYLPRSIMLISDAKLLENKIRDHTIGPDDQAVESNKLIANALSIWTEMTDKLKEQILEEKAIEPSTLRSQFSDTPSGIANSHKEELIKILSTTARGDNIYLNTLVDKLDIPDSVKLRRRELLKGRVEYIPEN
jgi:hypothetical protein